MHLYIHVPYCHRICPYCSFYKHTPKRAQAGKFVEAILQEAFLKKRELGLDDKVATLYLGGGTPSMLSEKHLGMLFDGLRRLFVLEDTHITFEANPKTFHGKKARFFFQCGVNRVSLGAQSFDSKVLATLGRTHTSEDIKDSVRFLREAGIPELNLDLMFAVPFQGIESWEASVQEAIKLGVEHISAYNLTYEEDTDFFKKLQSGDYKDEQKTNERFFLLAQRLLERAGYTHYETSNYAKPTFQSMHNLAYWRGESYLGLGPSAVSTWQGMRWQNQPNTHSYVHRLLEGNLPYCSREQLSEEDFRVERIALLLRTEEGLDLSYVSEKKEVVDILLSKHLARIEEGRLFLQKRGKLLVDAIAVELL